MCLTSRSNVMGIPSPPSVSGLPEKRQGCLVKSGTTIYHIFSVHTRTDTKQSEHLILIIQHCIIPGVYNHRNSCLLKINNCCETIGNKDLFENN